MTTIDTDLTAHLSELGCSIEPCGSRVTCSQIRPDADHDYLVHINSEPGRVEQRISEAAQVLANAGFKPEGTDHYQNMAADSFISWRRGEINLIVTANAGFADRHRAATHVCRRLDLQDKADRIALFQAVLYANKWEPTTPGSADR